MDEVSTLKEEAGRASSPLLVMRQEKACPWSNVGLHQPEQEKASLEQCGPPPARLPGPPLLLWSCEE